jgi:hypothetical protein
MRWFLGAALFAVLCVGCGGDNRTIPPVTQDLQEVWEIYKAHVDKTKKPPAKLEQLLPFEPPFVNGYAAASDGRIVVLWGTPTGATDRLLAYLKEAPQSGGHVLFADGTIKELSANNVQDALNAAGVK